MLAFLYAVQAAMAADFAIGQFRFLERLLLVHGRWCYRRISLMVMPSSVLQLTICQNRMCILLCLEYHST